MIKLLYIISIIIFIIACGLMLISLFVKTPKRKQVILKISFSLTLVSCLLIIIEKLL